MRVYRVPYSFGACLYIVRGDHGKTSDESANMLHHVRHVCAHGLVLQPESGTEETFKSDASGAAEVLQLPERLEALTRCVLLTWPRPPTCIPRWNVDEVDVVHHISKSI